MWSCWFIRTEMGRVSECDRRVEQRYCGRPSDSDSEERTTTPLRLGVWGLMTMEAGLRVL